MALPPLLAGAVKLTVACLLPALAETPVGAPGTVAAVVLAKLPATPPMVTLVITVVLAEAEAVCCRVITSPFFTTPGVVV